MNYRLQSTQCDAVTGVRTPCDMRLADAERQAQHLRSWAVVRGATVAGPSFLRVHGDGDVCSMVLPTGGSVAPDPETGITLEALEAGLAIVVEGVPFDQLKAVVRALRQSFGSESGLAGWSEFRASRDGWKSGTLTWRVRSLPASLPESFDVEPETEPAAVPAPSIAVEPLAGRRFSLHLPRWRRQDS